MWEWVAFWLFCSVLAVCYWAPRIIRARAEANCCHKWALVREGKLYQEVGEEGEEHRECVGPYSLYRCEVCGGSREYS